MHTVPLDSPLNPNSRTSQAYALIGVLDILHLSSQCYFSDEEARGWSRFYADIHQLLGDQEDE